MSTPSEISEFAEQRIEKLKDLYNDVKDAFKDGTPAEQSEAIKKFLDERDQAALDTDGMTPEDDFGWWQDHYDANIDMDGGVRIRDLENALDDIRYGKTPDIQFKDNTVGSSQSVQGMSAEASGSADVSAIIDRMKEEFLDIIESGDIPVSEDLVDRHSYMSPETVDLVIDGLEALKGVTDPEERAAILMELEALTAGAAGEGLISGLDSFDDLVEEAQLDELIIDMDDWDYADIEPDEMSMEMHTSIVSMSGDISNQAPRPEEQQLNQAGLSAKGFDI